MALSFQVGPRGIRKLPLQRLQARLKQAGANTYMEVEQYFSAISGVQEAGLDQPTNVVCIDYTPELVTRERLILGLDEFGYPYELIGDGSPAHPEH
jgi:hypothetical protein